MKKVALICLVCAVIAAIIGIPSIYAAAANRAEPVTLELTYPAGKSPRVFTKGWVFGVRCISNPGTRKQKDISSQVAWSGSGAFLPSTGKLSRPTFTKAGTNTIKLKVKVGKRTIVKTYYVAAVSPANYASVGTIAYCASDSHGCPSCPHAVKGPIMTGSRTVTVNGKPAARVGDKGKHAICCGPNTFVVASGDPNVLIDGKRAARIGDTSKHCGGVGVVGKKPSITIPTTTTTTTKPLTPNIGTRLSGTWDMNAVGYTFWMKLQVNGNQINGTMARKDNSEPVDPVVGTFTADGKVNFTRTRAGEWKQAYTGTLTKTSSGKDQLSGTFDGSSWWTATK